MVTCRHECRRMPLSWIFRQSSVPVALLHGWIMRVALMVPAQSLLSTDSAPSLPKQAGLSPQKGSALSWYDVRVPPAVQHCDLCPN